MPRDDAPMWPRTWTQAVGREIARLRRQADLSQIDLSVRCEGFGLPNMRNAIVGLENGRREGITVHELVVIAAALLVDPAQLLFPGVRETRHVDEETGEEVAEPSVEYFPHDVIPSRQAWERFNGPSPGSVRVVEARVLSERAARLLRDVEAGTGRG